MRARGCAQRRRRRGRGCNRGNRALGSINPNSSPTLRIDPYPHSPPHWPFCPPGAPVLPPAAFCRFSGGPGTSQPWESSYSVTHPFPLPTLPLDPYLRFPPHCLFHSPGVPVLPPAAFRRFPGGPGDVATMRIFSFNHPSLPLPIGIHLIVRSPPLPSHSRPTTPLLPHQHGS